MMPDHGRKVGQVKRTSNRGRWTLSLTLFAAGGLAACTDGVPTTSDPRAIPVGATTVAVDLPFDQFASDLRVDGGYASAADLRAAILARGDDGVSESRALARWTELPRTIAVPPAGDGVVVSDSVWAAVGGELVLFVDTAQVVGGESFNFAVERVSEGFDVRTMSWTHAVDTLGDRRAWSVPGGGAREPAGSVVWVPSLGDSLVVPLDSATAVALANRDDPTRALLVRVEEGGAYLRVFEMGLRLHVRPESRPDTIITVIPNSRAFSFIHSAPTEFGSGDPLLAVGGAPSFRTSFRINLPATVTATGAACGGAPTCQIELLADRVVFAAVVVTTAPPLDPLLAPADTMLVGLRPVLAPSLLPRSPLGPSVQGQPRTIAPAAFLGEGSRDVEIPVTVLVRALLEGPGPGEDPAPSTLSLVAGTEPSGLGIATFLGPSSDTPPRLRLLLTLSDGVLRP
jgi:hypothetical protein